MAATAILAAAMWGTCVVYFGDSQTGTSQTILAAAFFLFGLLAFTSLFVRRGRNILLTIYVCCFFGILFWWLSIEPSNRRRWQSDVAELAYADVDGDFVTVHNIRNFKYRSELDYQPDYYTRTYDLRKLQGVDLFAVYWMGPAIAHTIMSFNFGDDGHLAISVEARKEQNEDYSSIKGFFRQYELIYIVADERDVIGLRTNYRNNPPEDVYLYPIHSATANGKRLFLEYAKSINELHDNPAFYNTLLANCTNVIWLHTRVNPEHLPFSWKILLSGYVPQYLYESNRLDRRLPFFKLQQQAHINKLAVQDGEPKADFSQRIRKVIQAPHK